MEILVIFAIAWAVKQVMVDAKYAALGKTPPRWQAKLERLRQSGRATDKPRYASRDYFADLWTDALEASTERRRARSARRKAADLDNAVDEALAVATAPPVDELAEVAPQVKGVEPVQESAAAEPESIGPDARVIQMFPAKREVPIMSVSEVTGLSSAIAYAEAMATVHEQHSLAGGEAYLGSLEQFGVSGRAIVLVASAQETSANAAEAWRSAAAELAKQHVVREAYDAVPDAGTKAFVQGE